jgi:hypothetical protein
MSWPMVRIRLDKVVRTKLVHNRNIAFNPVAVKVLGNNLLVLLLKRHFEIEGKRVVDKW